MGQLPSHQMDAWASSLASSVFYRQRLRQRRLRTEIGHSGHSSSSKAGDVAAESSALPFVKGHAPSASAVGIGARGLAAGLKDNAARVLRSSASTGNLKSGGANNVLLPPASQQLSTVNEDMPAAGELLTSASTVDFAGMRGRRSLDIQQSPSDSAALPLPPSLSSTALQPPLIARSRAKSRSRSRNSMVIVNSLGIEETPLSVLIQDSRVTAEDNPMQWDWATIRTIILGPIGAESGRQDSSNGSRQDMASSSSRRRRLPEEINSSGFLARLSRFFHPASLEFCDLSRTTANEEYLEIGRQLIRILISSADGLLLIDESRLLSGIVDEIKKQDGLARKK
ncbi:hypothetical protein IWW38_005642, partial [Coemansia aciculifera]